MPNALREVEALARLLDDPDEDVQASVRARLDELGRDALLHLRTVRDQTDEGVREEIDAIMHDLHVSDVMRAWQAVLRAPDVSLERGAFLLALYRFPQLDIPQYQAQLDDYADAIAPRVEMANGAEKAFVLADYMCNELGFTPNREHYYDPNNSYINRVLDRKLGIPVSLSVIYLLLSQRLGLPVYGVNMPAHFLVKYEDQRGEIFIDLFDEGQPISKDACIRFLLRAGIQPRAHYFERASSDAILLRMVRNLFAIAQDANQKTTARDLERMLDPDDPGHDAEGDSEHGSRSYRG